MEYLVGIIFAAALITYLVQRRGKKTVRAALYLIALDEGFSTQDANMATQNLSFADAGKHFSAIASAAQPFGGSQLQMIAAARSRGFRG